MAHNVVITDLMAGTDVKSQLRSVIYKVDGEPTALDNGAIVVVGELIEGERELRNATAPKADSALSTLALVAAPEYAVNSYDAYFIDKGEAARVYFFNAHDIFSATEGCFDKTPAVGDIIEATAGTKMKVVKTATSGSTKIGTVIDTFVENGYTFYSVEV